MNVDRDEISGAWGLHSVEAQQKIEHNILSLTSCKTTSLDRFYLEENYWKFLEISAQRFFLYVCLAYHGYEKNKHLGQEW